MSRDSRDAAQRRAQLAAETKAYLERGGAVRPAEPGRRHPCNEDRSNTYLFLGRRR